MCAGQFFHQTGSLADPTNQLVAASSITSGGKWHVGLGQNLRGPPRFRKSNPKSASERRWRDCYRYTAPMQGQLPWLSRLAERLLVLTSQSLGRLHSDRGQN